MQAAPEMHINVREFFSDKCILITGVTGLVGKVLLEKILRTIPRIGKIYLLIRDTPKYSIQERVMNMIFASPLFVPLFKERPELHETIKARVVPIKGDLVLDGLGIGPEIRKLLTDEVEIILNTASRYNLSESIREAIQINYFGALRILELAHSCKNLIALHHVSTAYVASNTPNNSTCLE